MGWAILGHRPTGGWALATVVCLLGLALLMAPDVNGGSTAGLLLALGAALCIAGWNTAAKVQLDRGTSPVDVTAGSFTLAGLLLLPLLATQPLGWVSEPRGLALALYLGIATMGLANVLLSPGIRHLTTGPVTTLMLTDPVVATLLGVLVLGEVLAPVAIAGVVLLLVGLFLQGALVARTAPGEPEAARCCEHGPASCELGGQPGGGRLEEWRTGAAVAGSGARACRRSGGRRRLCRCRADRRSTHGDGARGPVRAVVQVAGALARRRSTDGLGQSGTLAPWHGPGSTTRRAATPSPRPSRQPGRTGRRCASR